MSVYLLNQWVKTVFFDLGNGDRASLGGSMLGRGVFDFSRKGPFDIEEANEIVRVLNRVTQKYSLKVSELITKLEALGPSERQKTTEIEAVIGRLIEEWNGKVRRLGGIPKGLWLVDIDNGQGYYCWKFPEHAVEHWHDYNSGYAGRVPLKEPLKEVLTGKSQDLTP